MKEPLLKYLKKNFDEAAILACIANLTFQSDFVINEDNQIIFSALKRSSEEFKYSSIEEISNKLSEYSDDQILGLVSNVKGIAHEMEFVKIENEDGDSIFASLYPDTNHAGYDIQLFDEASGEHWDVQLKATDNSSYVNDWIDQHPNGDILVTDEIADKMDLQSSGISNSEITAKVDNFVNKLIDYDDIETLASYFPGLAFSSVAIIIWELWNRYKSGEISYARFKLLSAFAAGKKTIKIGALIVLLSIPVLNVVVGGALVAKIIYSTNELASGQLDKIQISNSLVNQANPYA